MSVYALAELVAVAVLVALTQDRRGVARWLAMVAAPVAAALALLALSGWVVRPAPPDLVDVLSVGFVAAIAVVGLTPLGGLIWERLAMVVKPRWAFDRRLHAALEVYNRELRALPPPGQATERQKRAVLDVGSRTIERLTRLHAPDADWAAVRDAYVSLLRDELEAFAHGTTTVHADEISKMNAELSQRVLQLRRRYQPL